MVDEEGDVGAAGLGGLEERKELKDDSGSAQFKKPKNQRIGG